MEATEGKRKKVMGTGKKKIEIKKITKQAARMVTFSKRRKGLFKKAEELHSKYGADVAAVVFSPAGRPYTYPQSSSAVNATIDRCLSSTSSVGGGNCGSASASASASASHVLKSWLESINVETCDNLEELMILQKQLEETRDRLATRIECQDCGVGEKSTPAMGQEPADPGTLCNACGLMGENMESLDIEPSTMELENSYHNEDEDSLDIEPSTVEQENSYHNQDDEGKQETLDMEPSTMERENSYHNQDDEGSLKETEAPFFILLESGNFSMCKTEQDLLGTLEHVPDA